MDDDISNWTYSKRSRLAQIIEQPKQPVAWTKPYSSEALARGIFSPYYFYAQEEPME